MRIPCGSGRTDAGVESLVLRTDDAPPPFGWNLKEFPYRPCPKADHDVLLTMTVGWHNAG